MRAKHLANENLYLVVMFQDYSSSFCLYSFLANKSRTLRMTNEEVLWTSRKDCRGLNQKKETKKYTNTTTTKNE